NNKRPVPERIAVGLALQDERGILVARRPDEGLFGGLHELPGGFAEPGEPPAKAMARLAVARLGIEPGTLRPAGNVRHVLTHMRITLHVYRATAVAPQAATGFYTNLAWVDPCAPAGIGMSTLARKSLAVLLQPDPQVPLL
ncbi:MAG: NUDIX domain-containing protein, partial [Myxococcota bacterium]|nr:NUDIX domain-containing protein [Myxococcota bacterium]